MQIVGCKHLSTVPSGDMAFLDATATCLILVKRDPPINPVLDDDGGLDRSSTSHMRGTQRRSTICALMVSRSRPRRTGRAACFNGPRAYFHDADGRVLEFIDLTSYAGGRL